jgi:hypothetical protein
MRLSRGSRYLIVMTLPWLFLLASAIAVFAIVHTSHAEVHPGAGPHPPVVVELFTSEGCSSCPPADRLLAEIQEQSRPGAEIIVLSEHVDYWNYIGWQDPFSSKQFSDRQSAYAQTVGSDEIYTPQMVVDGAAAFIGSDAARATKEIARAATVPKRSLNVTAKEVPGAVIEASIQPSELEPGDTVFIAVAEDGLETVVKRGENAGRALSHTGVVRLLKELRPNVGSGGTLKTTLDLSPEWRKNNLRVVMFQQDKSKRVVAAAAVKPEFLLN